MYNLKMQLKQFWTNSLEWNKLKRMKSGLKFN